MLKIGLTGGIASGKSTVAGMLAQLGAPVFDADREAHLLLRKDGGAYEEIKAKFADGLGLDILAGDGEIDRKKLGAIVFSQPELRKVLENVIHRQIRAACNAFISEQEGKKQPAVILDIPLLIENLDKGWREKIDCVWLVYVPAEMQKARLVQREGLSSEEVEKRLKAQLPIEAKKEYADLIVDNSGELEKTKEQVFAAWQKSVCSGGSNG